jgi:cytidylate kinase
MAIVTISRTLGSYGKEIAQELAGLLNIGLFDRETLGKLMIEKGQSMQLFDKFDEKKPSFWDNFTTDRDRYANFIKLAVYNFVKNGSGLILGRGGQCLLGTIPGTFSVRIVAPEEQRIQRLKEKYSCDSGNAKHIMHKSDHERAGFHRFFFNANWEDASLYDLVINTRKLDISEAAKNLADIIGKSIKKEDTKTAEKTISNLITGQEIIHKILFEKKLHINLYDAEFENGTAVLKGSAVSLKDIELASEAAKEIQGVKEVVNSLVFVNQYPMI